MRRILLLLTLFSCCTLAAQPITTTNREFPRSAIRPYASAEEAVAAPKHHRYGSVVEEWQAEGSRFKAAFTVPFAWTNRQVVMRIADASAPYTLYINGREIATNTDSNTPADFLITKQVREGRNEVEIRLEAGMPMRAIEGWKGDADPKIGTVELLSPPTMGIREVLTTTRRTEERVTAEIGVVVKSYALNPRTVRIYYDLTDPAGERVGTGHGDLTLRMRGEDTLRWVVTIPDSLCWSSERPQHYTLHLRTQREGRNMEFHTYLLGLRTVALHEGNLLINGKKVVLQVAECGANVTAEQLANLKAAGKNLVRLPAAAASRGEAIYTACDTLGLYVIAPTAIDGSKAATSRCKGGSPSNDPAWRSTYIERAANAYHSAKRHPSVVGFTIGERAANGICLYESYLHLKGLEAQRPILYFDSKGEWNHDALR